MREQLYRWKNKQIREHIAILDGKKSPTKLLKNVHYLHSSLRRWMDGNIWIKDDRIVYAGKAIPENIADHCEIVDCSGQTVVPGYIEPHVHPFQLYNPHTFAKYVSQTGTTTIINDNLVFALLLDKEKAFSLLRGLSQLPITMYWWARFDSQTELENEEEVFSNESVKAWLEHESVLQGGELTAWPKLLSGDDLMLHWIQVAKRANKKIEGHFPGASEKTIAKMALFGVDNDHESMTGKEISRRLLHGMTVALRHSSIRPDLPVLLKEIKELGLDQYDAMFFTTDGSTPSFYENGVLDMMIRIALENGIPAIDAYNMASYNIARFYDIHHYHGMIATGRVANLNILEDEKNPTPVSVLSKGKWLKRNNKDISHFPTIDWKEFGFPPLDLSWDITSDDLQFSMPFGIEMVNDVITKPYSVTLDFSLDELSLDHDESFLLLLDRNGKWRLNTMLKGFANKVTGFASSFSYTGDILLIGKSKADMVTAFNRLKEIGGGIVLAENRTVIHEIPLPIGGIMSKMEMSQLIDQQKELKKQLVKRGYQFDDPVYSLLFFSSTHLPYIRVTQKGLIDVMNKTVLFPTIMR